MKYPIDLILSHHSLSKFLQLGLSEFDVPGLGMLRFQELSVSGDHSSMSLDGVLSGFFNGTAKIEVRPFFDKVSAELKLELINLTMKSSSLLQQMGSSLSKPIIESLISKKLRISEEDLEKLLSSQLAAGLNTGLSMMGIESQSGVEDLSIQNVFCSADGLHIHGGLNLKIHLK